MGGRPPADGRRAGRPSAGIIAAGARGRSGEPSRTAGLPVPLGSRHLLAADRARSLLLAGGGFLDVALERFHVVGEEQEGVVQGQVVLVVGVVLVLVVL